MSYTIPTGIRSEQNQIKILSCLSVLVPAIKKSHLTIRNDLIVAEVEDITKRGDFVNSPLSERFGIYHGLNKCTDPRQTLWNEVLSTFQCNKSPSCYQTKKERPHSALNTLISSC